MKKIGDFIYAQKRAIQYYGKWGWVFWRMRLVRNWLYWSKYFRTFCFWDVAVLTPPRFSDTDFKLGDVGHIIKVAKLHGVDGWDDDE